MDNEAGDIEGSEMARARGGRRWTAGPEELVGFPLDSAPIITIPFIAVHLASNRLVHNISRSNGSGNQNSDNYE